jgi:hypothetical protein
MGPNSYAVPDLRDASLLSGAQWLQTSLAEARPYIYHTQAGRDLWETLARTNITRWLELNIKIEASKDGSPFKHTILRGMVVTERIK